MYEPKSPYTQSNRIQRIVYIPAILFTILLIPTLLVFATSGKINPQAPSRIAPKPQSTINVTTTDDELDDDGYCSLREALTAANTDTALTTALPVRGMMPSSS